MMYYSFMIMIYTIDEWQLGLSFGSKASWTQLIWQFFDW